MRSMADLFCRFCDREEIDPEFKLFTAIQEVGQSSMSVEELRFFAKSTVSPECKLLRQIH